MFNGGYETDTLLSMYSHMLTVALAKFETPASIARKMTARIKPYSTAVAARLSLKIARIRRIALSPAGRIAHLRAELSDTSLTNRHQEARLCKKIRQ